MRWNHFQVSCIRLVTSIVIFSFFSCCPIQASNEELFGPYCGLYCVYGSVHMTGRDIQFETLLRPRYLSSPQGSSSNELRQAAIDAGAHAVVVEGLGAETLRASRNPMILHVAKDGQLKRYDHWVVFCGMKDGAALLLDPPQSIDQISLAELLARWDGTAIVVSSSPIDTSSIIAPEAYSLVSLTVIIGVTIFMCQLIIRRLKCVPLNCESRRIAQLFWDAVWQSVAISVCCLVPTLILHVLDDVGLLRNPSAARYVAAANIARFFPKVSLTDVRRSIFESRATVIDARYSTDFERGHLPGAINLPIDVTSANLRTRLRSTSREARLIVYCQSQRCDYGEVIATILAREGFKKISIYKGGWMEWKQHERFEQ